MSGSSVESALQKSVSSVLSRFLSGVGGEHLARREARAENVRRSELLKGEIDRNRQLALAEHDQNVANALLRKQEKKLTRAIDRMRLEELIKQDNIEAVLDKVFDIASRSKDPAGDFNEENFDWIFLWFRYAQEVSHSELQQFWAHIFVEQVGGSNGVISKKALDALRFLDLNTARIFKFLVSRMVLSEECLDYEIFVANGEDEGMQIACIEGLELLKDIGLIRTSSYQRNSLSVFGLSIDFIEIDLSKPGVLHVINLSRIGEELMSVAVPEVEELRVDVKKFVGMLNKKRNAKLPRKMARTSGILNKTARRIAEVSNMAVSGFGYEMEIKDVIGDVLIGKSSLREGKLTLSCGEIDHLSEPEKKIVEEIFDAIRRG